MRATWIFDLDNTLHDTGRKLFPIINKKMNRYIQNLLKINEYEADQKRAEGFLSGNRLLRGEKRKKKSKTVPVFANMYFTGFGLLLMYLMYKMVHKK